MNGQLRNALLALVLLLTSFFFFFQTNSIEATGGGNCGCGTGYELVDKVEDPDWWGVFKFWQWSPIISKVVVKAGSQEQGTACFETTSDGTFGGNCYEADNIGNDWSDVKVWDKNNWGCKDISHVEFCKKVQPTPTPTPTPAEYCDLDKLDVWPLSGNWNYTGKFRIKNISHKPMTFDWLLDNWDDDSQDQTGTKTLKPGKTIDLGLGKICSKWQLDLKCPTDARFDKKGYIVESHQSACVTPTTTPACTATPTPTNTPTPTGTPEPTGTPVPTATPGTGGPTPTPVLTGEPTPTPEICEQRTWSCESCQEFGDENRLCYEDKLGYCMDNYGCKWENDSWVCTDTCQAIPTPTEGPGKNVKFEVTAISCTNTNFDAKVIATENGQPLKGVKVQFEYKNEKIDRVTDDQGIAQAGYSFKGVDQIKARPDGFPEQSARIDDAANCPAPTVTPGTGGGEVLGANTQPQGQVLGVNTLAPTGMMEDLLMKFASLLGTAMTMVGSVLYGQKKRSAAR